MIGHFRFNYAGRNNSKSSSGSSGHTGGTRPGQTCQKPKDLSGREGEECGRGEGGLCMLFVFPLPHHSNDGRYGQPDSHDDVLNVCLL
jgi:hypothetical protein